MFDDYIKNHVIPWLVHRYYGKTWDPFDGMDTMKGWKDISKVIMRDGSVFKAEPASQWTLFDTYREYIFSDVSKDDIVLDIGANVGGATIQLARKAKTVLALEPLYCNELKKNIMLNNLANVTVLEGALGERTGTTVYTEWAGRENKETPVYSFRDLVAMCGGHVDFLKCDCEGAEFAIPLTELFKIPKIEMELHYLEDPRATKIYEFMYGMAPNWGNNKTCMIHARREIK